MEMRYDKVAESLTHNGKIALKPKRVQMAAKREYALELWLKGLTYAEIGIEIAVSRQRVQQMVSPPKAIRDRIKARAHDRCEQCEVELEHGHIHHKNARGRTADDFNDRSNLEYLCVGCHMSKHSKG